MKSDIDALMETAKLDFLLVFGDTMHNPFMTYFTGQAHLSEALLVKPRRGEPILFHQPMERDEAARTGLKTKGFADFNQAALLKQADGDFEQARLMLMERIFDQFNVGGRVSVYGSVEIGPYFNRLRELERRRAGLELVGEPMRDSVLLRARATKDETEIERIRAIGKTTVAVVGNVADFLASHQAKDGLLINGQGEPLTIGEVKRRINLWLAMRGAENPKGTIFAQGRDAGVPHSSGQDDQPIRVGDPIVFDIFPTEAGGGYYYDFTRTWCPGFASEEVQQLYDDVLAVYHSVYADLTINTSCRSYQIKTCEGFQELGHPTVLDHPETTDGYVHSLAHGIGLAVHEGPSFSHLDVYEYNLSPGTVFTFEPGLYYPDRGMGVRLEDTVWARPDGTFETLVEYPMDLVIKIPGV